MAVNRVAPGSYRDVLGEEAVRDVFLPDERLDLPTAVRMFTLGSAYVNHLDDVTGSIEVGKRADLVVLDRNLFDLPAEELLEAKALLTMVDGERVHAVDGFA
jgi:predicted amidohydrolase YtcJ